VDERIQREAAQLGDAKTVQKNLAPCGGWQWAKLGGSLYGDGVNDIK